MENGDFEKNHLLGILKVRSWLLGPSMAVGPREVRNTSVKAVGDHAFTIGRGLWKQEVKYRYIISLKIVASS